LCPFRTHLKEALKSNEGRCDGVAVKVSDSKKKVNHDKPVALDKPINKLNARQLKFCELYLSGMAANRAYIEAGYNVKNANVARIQASALMTKPSVREYIAKTKKEIVKTYEINRSVLLDEMMKIALGQTEEERYISVFVGGGCSEARLVKQKTNPRERVKALEFLLMLTEEDPKQITAEDDPITKSIKESIGK
jgi:phage terminase small subunit